MWPISNTTQPQPTGGTRSVASVGLGWRPRRSVALHLVRRRMTRFFRGRESGQVTLWFALSVILIVLCMALVADFGFAYVTRAQLSKAVDAATLMGVRDLHQGETLAAQIARNTFSANYPQTGRDVSTPVPTVGIATDNLGRRTFAVSATTRINTFFLRVIPQWQTLTVASEAEAVRSRAVVALVLDKSGSMQSGNKWSALGPSVDVFVSLFSDQMDKMSLTLYSRIGNTPVTMRQPFKTIISNNVPRAYSAFSGATFMSDGLRLGRIEINREPVLPGENVIRAAVFFTDGKANIIQERLMCERTDNPRTNTWNFGGYDSGNGYAVFYTNGTVRAYGNSSSPYRPGDCDDPGLRSFNRIFGGVQNDIRQPTISAEAEDRTMYLADQMRAEGTIIYVIGLGSGNQINRTWLLNLANDPLSTSFNPSLQPGKAVFPATANELRNAFQFIASDIVGRLTR
ncbi:MAG: TadE/TadG family protein [Verrucomicrobia bacterium]|nr:TadE/TadG family protein [Verrucomicrobiota bacterium]